MGELAKYFLFGFFLTSIPATTGALIANSQPPQTQVLAENVEVTQPPLASAELSEDGSPSPKVSQTPEPSPPEASPSQAPTPTPDVWPPADLEPLFTRFASEFSADQNMLEYIANCESHYNPLAINGDYVGMFQFGSLTWQKYRVQIGANPDPTLRTSAEESIKTAAYILARFGGGFWPRCSM